MPMSESQYYPVKVVVGDILDFLETRSSPARHAYIVQQCNCTSTKPHGLSLHIALRYPHANVYSERQLSTETNGSSSSSLAPKERWSEPGTILVRRDAEGEHGVICAFAQLGVGKPGTYKNSGFQLLGPDSYELRLSWFRQCLRRIAGSVPD